MLRPIDTFYTCNKYKPSTRMTDKSGGVFIILGRDFNTDSRISHVIKYDSSQRKTVDIWMLSECKHTPLAIDPVLGLITDSELQHWKRTSSAMNVSISNIWIMRDQLNLYRHKPSAHQLH